MRNGLSLAFALVVTALSASGISPAVSEIAPRPSFLTGVDEEVRTRFLFFAVLEGLYLDGVQQNVARRVLSETENDVGLFVPSCPICMPVRDAFSVYAQGPRLMSWLKGRTSPPRPEDPLGFGAGLDGKEIEKFLDSERTVRAKALLGLVDRYCRDYEERLRLSPEERDRLKRLLAEGRKLGMLQLQGRPEFKDDFGEYCPACDGATKEPIQSPR